MKKSLRISLTALLLALLTALLAGCSGGTASGGTKIEGELTDIMAKIYETADVDPDTRDFLGGLDVFEIPADQFEYYFFVKDVDYSEALASVPMINVVPYQVCLLRVNDGVDVEQLKKDIAANADPRKWVCVEVDPSDVRVESEGDLILFVMAENSEKYAEAFHKLAG